VNLCGREGEWIRGENVRKDPRQREAPALLENRLRNPRKKGLRELSEGKEVIQQKEEGDQLGTGAPCQKSEKCASFRRPRPGEINVGRGRRCPNGESNQEWQEKGWDDSSTTAGQRRKMHVSSTKKRVEDAARKSKRNYDMGRSMTPLGKQPAKNYHYQRAAESALYERDEKKRGLRREKKGDVRMREGVGHRLMANTSDPSRRLGERRRSKSAHARVLRGIWEWGCSKGRRWSLNSRDGGLAAISLLQGEERKEQTALSAKGRLYEY